MVDEASMVKKSDSLELIELCKSNNVFLICSGDQYQHFPVKEKSSHLIEVAKETAYVELTKIMRQIGGEGNPISEIVTRARQAVIDNEKGFDIRSLYDESRKVKYGDDNQKEAGYYVFWESADGIRQTIRAWQKAFSLRDAFFIRAICYRNDSVDYLNKTIRFGLFGEMAANDYLVGDYLVAKSPVTKTVKGTTAYVVQVDTGSTVEVLEVTAKEYSYSFKVYLDEMGDTFETNKNVKKLQTVLKHARDGRSNPDDTEGKVELLEKETNSGNVRQFFKFHYSYKGYELKVKNLATNLDTTVDVVRPDLYKKFEQDCENLRKFVVEMKQKFGLKFTYHQFKMFNLVNKFKYAYAVNTHCVQGWSLQVSSVWLDDICTIKDNDSKLRAQVVALGRAKEKLLVF
jgi:AAA domain